MPEPWRLPDPPSRRNWLPEPGTAGAPAMPASAPARALSHATGGELRNADNERETIRRDWVRATRDFRCIYDGQVERVERGDRFRRGHRIVNAHPEHFERDGLRRGDPADAKKAADLTGRDVAVLQGQGVIR